MVEIIKVEREGPALDIIRMLFKEYLNELNENLGFQSFDDELENPLKKYGAPSGSLFLAYVNNQPAGCIALQPLKESGVCEMKRLYVAPGYRKNHCGDELVKTLLHNAQQKGYTKMVLDTLERLQPAIKLYLRHHFTVTSPYYENPLPNVVYMERML
jgi:ribosomal protein S18 acetylase RimI-like enzyme